MTELTLRGLVFVLLALIPVGVAVGADGPAYPPPLLALDRVVADVWFRSSYRCLKRNSLCLLQAQPGNLASQHKPGALAVREGLVRADS